MSNSSVIEKLCVDVKTTEGLCSKIEAISDVLFGISATDSEAREAIHQTMDSYLEDLRVVIHDITESAMQLTFNVAAKKARCKCRE